MTTCIYYTIFDNCRQFVNQHGDSKKVVCPNCNKRMRGYAYRTVRTQAMAIANNRCQKPNCGKEHNLDCHHKRPICWGGKNTLDNMIILCKDHHIEAHFYIGLPIR